MQYLPQSKSQPLMLAALRQPRRILRVFIDPKYLNAALSRERYQPPVLDDVLPELAQYC